LIVSSENLSQTDDLECFAGQMIPTLASCSFDEIVDAAKPGQVQFMQLYVNKDREITRKIVQYVSLRSLYLELELITYLSHKDTPRNEVSRVSSLQSMLLNLVRTSPFVVK